MCHCYILWQYRALKFRPHLSLSSSMLLKGSSTSPCLGVPWLSRSSSLPDRFTLAASSDCILSLRTFTVHSSSCIVDDSVRHLSQIQVLNVPSSLEFIADSSSSGRERHNMEPPSAGPFTAYTFLFTPPTTAVSARRCC